MTSKPPNMLQAAVYSFLIGYCLDLYLHTAEAVKKAWGLEESDLDGLMLCSPPSTVQNLIVSRACYERFGDALALVDGFYRCGDYWQMDVDGSLALRGILMPVRDSRGWFSALRIFRHVKDARPFLLRTRRERTVA